MLTIEEDLLFFAKNNKLKYMTAWEGAFVNSLGKFSRPIFYPGNPHYVVGVELLSNINIKQEDVYIGLGKLHSSEDIKTIIEEKTNEIFELCKNAQSVDFVLDIKAMKILTADDFIEEKPIWGLNTLFKLGTLDAHVRCLVNASKESFKDGEFFSWFLSYLNSMSVCLRPNNSVDVFAKLFMQYMSCRFNNTDVIVTDAKPILNCPLPDSGNLLLTVPGKTERLMELLSKSLEQRRKEALKNTRRGKL